jgi:hypothetical protein
MGGVPAAKAGVGSAGNDATRLLGGTLGVAVIGSTSSTPVSQRIATPVRGPAGQQHARCAVLGRALQDGRGLKAVIDGRSTPRVGCLLDGAGR